MLVWLAGCAASRPAQRFEFNRISMGVQCRVVLYAADHDAAAAAASRAFDRIAALDASMSDYRAESELNRLCAAAGGPPVPVSPDLFAVIRAAVEVSESSGGAFDITAAPLVALWRETRRTRVLPSPADLDAARSLVGWRFITLNEPARTVQLLQPGMKLDLGGIAKGYAAQHAIETLRATGHPRALVALSGDIAVGDPPPGEPGWVIAVQGSPDAPRPGSLLLTKASISTSGDEAQHVEIAGLRYSHIVNPRTGLGLTHSLSVTTISRRGELADALATAACILGPRDGADLIRRTPGVAAILAPLSSQSAAPAHTIIDPAGLLRWTAGPAPRLGRLPPP
jgi:thiamine biosynthesis lipoprotein